MLSQYKQGIDRDELTQCGRIGLWKALERFDQEGGLSLTTSVYNFVNWECLAHFKSRDKVLMRSSEYLPDIHSSGTIDDLDLTFLDDNRRKPIQQRILGRMSFREMAEENGHSTETERQSWLKLMRELKDDYTS